MTDEAGYEAFMAQAVPSSTVPSAAHSHRTLETHPSAAAVFEPPPGRAFQSFPTGQQVQGEFVPGAGGGTADYYRRQSQRSSTNRSGYSDSSNLSPSRNGQYTSPIGPGVPYYPNNFEYSSGSDAFPSSEQYTSPSAMSPDKYLSSPEQIPMHQPQQQQQGVFSVTQGPYTQNYQQQYPNALRGGGSYATGWQSVDNTAAIGPGVESASGIVSTGSGSSGGGGSAVYSSSSNPNPTPNSNGVRRQGGPIGRSHSMSARHAHSQSASGHLAPPSSKRPTKRQHQEEEDDDSEGEDEVQTRPGQRGGAKRLPGACSHCKRLKMKCVFENGHDVCQRCQHTNKVCIVEGRKPRQGPNKRELMMRELASKDQLIDSLLRQIHNPAMRTSINWPSSVPVPQQSTNTPERPPDKDVLAWIESIRQNRPPTPTGSIDASHPTHVRAHSEPLPAPVVEDDALSLGESASNVKDREDRPRTPAELRQDSAELPDTLHSIPPPAAPVGLIAKLSLTVNRDKRGSDAGMTGDAEEEDKWVGIGNTTYFEAGPSADPELRRIIIERQMPPEILTHGIIKPAEVETLFKIFFEQLNPFVAILDPHMHTPAFVFGRCPFLFTAICAISSRYYAKRPELYTIAMHFAKQSAATALIDGWKSVELVQAYILMSVYPVPARRWEEDRTWLYLGLAIRMATDLNLHLPWQGKATGEAHEREILNRTRTWLICFNLDRSGATQFGRPPTIREDYIVRKSTDWYKRSKFNLGLDVHLTAYTSLLRIVARFLAQVYSDSNTPTALNKNLDFLVHCTAADKELTEFDRETKELFDRESDHTDSACEYRCNLLPFLSNYSRLVIYSFGHQQAFQRGLEQGKIFFDKCYKAASEVVRVATDILAPSGRLKYSPDGHFVFLSFAAAFLLKMLRPQFAAACEPAQSARIIQLVTRLTEVLASNEVAIDDRHSPRLYSRFLTGLIAKHAQGGGMVLSKTGPTGTGGGAGPAGPSAGAPGKNAPGKGPGPNQSPNRGAGGSGVNKSAAATEAGMMHESPPSAPIPLAPEQNDSRDRIASLPPRMKSPPIVIHQATIDQSMHSNRVIDLTSPGPQSNHGHSPTHDPNPNIMGGYVTVEPGGETMSSMASTTQGEATVTDATGDMEMESHDMLAAMYALQDPTWWDTGLLPGFNANFADDGSNSSSEMRNAMYAQPNYNNMPPGTVNGMGMHTNHMNLFAPGLDFTQGMGMDHNDMGMDHMMAGYGYQ